MEYFESLGIDKTKEFLSIEDASKILGVVPRTIRRYCKQGKLKYVELDAGAISFTHEQLDEFMENYYQV